MSREPDVKTNEYTAKRISRLEHSVAILQQQMRDLEKASGENGE